MALLQSAPLLLLLGLLLSGRAGPVAACLAALAASLPGIALTLPGDFAGIAVFLVAEAARALFLGLQPVAVLTGGLLFHLAVTRLQPGRDTGIQASPRRILAATLLGGAFVESVTGFAVGAVFALAALRRMGIGGAPAGAMALLALVLVPWGGLGPGTSLGAALVHLPPQEVALATAWPAAAWLLCMPPVLWRLCGAAGLAVPKREMAMQFAVVVVMATLLVVANLALPFEVAGMVAAGLPLLLVLWRLDPPRGAAAWYRALAMLSPWALLCAALLLARSWTRAPSLQVWADLPPLPLTHVAVVLWLVSLALLAVRPEGLGTALKTTLRRAGRPAQAMLLYVLLGRWMAGSGVAAALAGSTATALGSLAAYAMAPLGLASGLITGSNVASNASLMAVQASLGQAAGLPAAAAAGLHNFMGAGGAGMSVGVTAMVVGLLADGTRPAQLWRLLWPSLAALLLIGWTTLALNGA
ncbi:hypothetical protein ACFOD4_14425 [Pseudoroseomonas globiformis]|uniref:L-lactate permease n=1 Tax=Teichococcus globiformis TaxID=2307229 RepID=A0ABV7G448_9PROT